MTIIKNARVYTFKDFSGFTVEQIKEQAFKPLHSQQAVGIGFVETEGFGDLFVNMEELTMLCMKIETKILPASVVNKTLLEQVKIIEKKEDRKISRKEKRALKDEIMFEMTPKAFSKEQLITVIFDWKNNLLIIDTASASIAENAINLIREATGSFNVVPLSTATMPMQVMSERIKANEPLLAVSEYGSKLQLVDFSTDTTHNYKNEVVFLDEIKTFIDSGMVVTQVEIVTDELICTVTEKLVFKSIKFSDLVLDKISEHEADTQEIETRANLLVAGRALVSFVMAVVREFGGLQE